METNRAMPYKKPTFHKTFFEIVDKYNGFIIDIWGILHNGISVYPEAINSLKYLNKKNKKVVLLSNAPRRNYAVIEMMQNIGFPTDIIQDIITSGEATYIELKDIAHKKYGRTLYHIGPERDFSVFEDLPYHKAKIINEADFILATGMTSFDQTLEEYLPILDQGLNKNLPLICANPDKIVKIGDQLPACAGAMAKYYEDKGGDVIYHGKPHSAIYEMAYQKLCSETPIQPSKILCIGDSLDTDILGGNTMGMDTAWVTDKGIHAREIQTLETFEDRESAIQNICHKHGIFPTFCVPSFICKDV